MRFTALFMIVGCAFLAASCAPPTATVAAEAMYADHDPHESHGHKHLVGGHSADDILGGPNTIEVFTGGCKLCAEASKHAADVGRRLKLKVVEYKIDSPEATHYGLKSAPSIVFEGKVLFTSLPTPEELESRIVGSMGK
ncbi:MAG TPA: thioredoxin family protein [Fimbriimonadaceae bacterium]|nr:thioredoxin family protein [Fimbriimonadaceae bacterium]HRJ97227.1 thioredoxin family protein [Fimbriimonadaceae bacterium]